MDRVREGKLTLQAVALVFFTLKFGAHALTTPAALGPTSELRLVGGASASEGRLEIFHSYQWGTVCNDFWGGDDAAVACRQLGYSAVITDLYTVAGAPDPPGTILLDDVRCTGDEGRLSECLNNGWGVHDCDHDKDVAIRCGYASTYANPMPIRLSGGSSSSGRLEMYLDHAWGTVCGDYWDGQDALVACRQLGFTAVADYSVSAVDEVAGPIHAYFVACQGSEAHLGQCVEQGPWAERYCGHDQDVTLACDSPTVEFSLRLAGGPHPSEGRLEVNWAGEWATVCDDYWDNRAAAVACRQMGLGYPSPLSGLTPIPPGYGTIALDDVMCQGWERRLVECGHLALGSHNCGHHEDVMMACSDNVDDSVQFPPTDSYVYRLVDGWSHYEGRVEVDIEGVSGGVCDAEWTLQDAAVVCRQLGFGTPIRDVAHETFGWNSGGYYWLDNVTCAGDESALEECPVGSRGQLRFCGSVWQDVGVACTGPYVGSEDDMRNAAVRLQGGKGDAEGRVEIFFNDAWSTVCGYDWDYSDAYVVCRQLGFRDVMYEWHYIDWLPMATGHILLSNVRCQGDESTIMGCRHNGLYTHDCTHSDDVVIVCQTSEGYDYDYDYDSGIGPIFGVIGGVFFLISACLFGVRRQMLLQRQRHLVVVPCDNAAFGDPPPPQPYPVQQAAFTAQQPAAAPPPGFPGTQQYGPATPHQPPYGPATAVPAVPPLGYPDPNPLPPSYLTATRGTDGVNQLPVYLPSPVAPPAAALPSLENAPPLQNQHNARTLRN